MSQLMPGSSLGFLLTDVSRLFRQSFEKAVEAGGLELTPGEIRVLAHVALKEPPTHAPRIASNFENSPPTPHITKQFCAVAIVVIVDVTYN